MWSRQLEKYLNVQQSHLKTSKKCTLKLLLSTCVTWHRSLSVLVARPARCDEPQCFAFNLETTLDNSKHSFLSLSPSNETTHRFILQSIDNLENRGKRGRGTREILYGRKREARVSFSLPFCLCWFVSSWILVYCLQRCEAVLSSRTEQP